MNAGAASFALACLAAAVSAKPHPALVARQAYVMGTQAALSTFDDDRATGMARLERLLAVIESTEQQLSTWRPASEVSQLNASAGRGVRDLSPSLCRAADALERWVGDTGAAFDPAIGALVAAWDIHGTGRVASREAVAAARQRSGWSRVRFDRTLCRIELADGVAIDVGAWGKGEGLDRARAALTGDSAPWLVDLGGQVAVHGKPPRASGWTVAIAHPRRRDTPALDVTLTSGSLATSGGSERDLQAKGRRVGHILDPRTGHPAKFAGSVTVWHEEALAADVLSTALFVMGPDAGLRWAEARGVAACYLVPAGNRVTRRSTPQFDRLSPADQRFLKSPQVSIDEP